MATTRNKRNISVYSIYLKSKGLDIDGKQLSSNDIIDEKNCKAQCMDVLAAKLSEAFASLDILVELQVLTDKDKNDIIEAAKSDTNIKPDRKVSYKLDISKKIKSAMDKAGKLAELGSFGNDDNESSIL